MPQRSRARLGSFDLPYHFKYQPYIPRKSMSTTATSGAVIHQAQTPIIIHGDGTIPWEIRSATPLEFKTLYDMYTDTDANGDEIIYGFLGYWGEDLEVKLRMDQGPVNSRRFDLTGSLIVVCVNNLLDISSCT